MDQKRVTSTALLGLLSIGFMRLPASAATPSRIDAPRTYITDAFPLQVIAINLDEDGDLDAAVLTAPVLGQPRLQLFENPGDGTLVSRAQVPLAADTRLAWADLNGDTRHDLVQVHSEDGLTGNLPFWCVPARSCSVRILRRYRFRVADCASVTWMANTAPIWSSETTWPARSCRSCSPNAPGVSARSALRNATNSACPKPISERGTGR